MIKYLVPLILFITVHASAWAAVQNEFAPGVSGIASSEISRSVAYFEYSPEVQYEINAQPGYITDLQLCFGDHITNIVAGDTERWMMDTATVGGIPHVYLKPTQTGISTNIIITTTFRVYRLLVHATDTYVPAVVWTYPGEYAARQAAEREKERVSSPEPAALYYNYNYQVKSKKKGWIPKVIYDDGTRTFISMPEDVKNDLPVIHIVNEDKKKEPALVNYRVKDGWFIVDRVFKTAILNFTQEQSITIYNRKGEEK
ncbi:MAG: TrbG/VirB9 family P-type conjugative transfer protein [Negativicutes bacterium]|nr:TrbG/VirB9 family P-type conjugative transfer protein [Negativicutes bacterium]